jgi:hypothetical protein
VESKLKLEREMRIGMLGLDFRGTRQRALPEDEPKRVFEDVAKANWRK